ncbi:MarR family winged helix-turn-helix transcriptional regulator [Specibacter sp. NPDC057265]|uniref:MarR family winged helix-turn-helix transcriptional regulator n=1 Tax=Specibacter sp. NPDC057265 TaxID=3346075 RepID=UPI00364275E9
MTSPPESFSPKEFLAVLYPLQRRLQAERTTSPGKFGILRHLAEHGQATASELAAAILVSPQAISLGTRELVAAGWVMRQADVVDRRKIWMQLTEAGVAQFERESAAGLEWVSRAANSRLTPDERELLSAALPLLRKLGAE